MGLDKSKIILINCVVMLLFGLNQYKMYVNEIFPLNS